MEFLYRNINTASSTDIVRTSQGILHSVVVNTTAAGTITISDANGIIAILRASVAEGTYLYDVAFVGFLRVVTTAASNLTVAYKA
ncbi:MAG: hypothetical protein DDT23_00967 [candidate division WS2 bacterium]|nr:hypothetical protein [Candidatus Lithacetigena glycinireducens]